MSGFFELNQLRCFVAVAEELHFGRAARRLNMSQPPLSRQIQVLERVLDVSLFERNSRSVKLTNTGRNFLPEAQRIIRMSEAARDLAKGVDAGKAGSVRIAFTAASAYSFLPRLLAAGQEQLSNIHLSLNEMVSRDQIEALLSGQVDIGLLRPPVVRAGLTSHCVATEALLVACPKAHPFAEQAAIAVEQLDQQPFIMYSAHEAHYFHDLIIALFARTGVLPTYVQHLAQVHSIVALVKAGLGLALVPESAAHLHSDGVVMRPLTGGEKALIELHMVWRRNDDNPVVPQLVALSRALPGLGQFRDAIDEPELA